MKERESETTIFSETEKVKAAGVLADRGLLVVVSDNFFGKTFVIEKPEVTAGRHSSCDIIVEDPLVSKEHFLICTDADGRFSVEDLGSKNGTFLNKKKVKKRTRMFYGDRLVVGNTIFRFFLEEKVSRK